MRKRYRYFIAALIMLAAAVSGCVPKTPAPDKFSAPKNYAYDPAEQVITFGRVSGAQSYSAYIDGADGVPALEFTRLTEEIIDVSGLPAGDYACKAKVNATAVTAASDYSYFDFTVAVKELPQLGKPSLVSKTGDSITWYSVQNATSYTVKVYDKLAPSVIKVNEKNVPQSGGVISLDVSGRVFDNGRVYVIEVTANAVPGAYRASPAGKAEFTGEFLPVLAAPQNVEKYGDTVSWDGVAGADNGYRVVIFEQGKPEETAVSTITAVNSYDIPATVNFTKGRTYIIYVYARAVEGCYSESAAGEGEFYVPLPVLGTPGGITADAYFTSVSWNAVFGAVTYTLKIYNKNTPSDIKLNNAAVTGVSRDISGLDFSPGTAYVFEVAANAVQGEYQASAAGRAEFTTIALLPTPQNVDKDGHTVSWTAVAGAANGYRVVIAEYEYGGSGAVIADAVVPGQAASSYNIGSGAVFTHGRDYIISVYARAVADLFLQSNAGVKIFTEAHPSLGRPDGIAVNPDWSIVSWNAVPDAQDYRLRIYAQNAPTPPLMSTNVSGASRNISGITFVSGTVYIFDVTANATETHQASPVGNLVLVAPSAPGLPVLDAPANVSKSGDTVSWLAVAGAAIGYNIVVFDRDNPSDVKVNDNTPSASYTLPSSLSFAPGHTYTINVYARGISGTSQTSAAGAAEFYIPLPALGTPVGAAVDANFDQILWNAVPDASAYRLKIYPQADPYDVKLDINLSNTYRNISGIIFVPDAVYVFEITANAIAGLYVQSNTASITAAAPKYRAPLYGPLQVDEKMIIGSWGGPDTFNSASVEIARPQSSYDILAASGINLTLPCDAKMDIEAYPNYVLDHLNKSAAAGIKALIVDSAFAWFPGEDAVTNPYTPPLNQKNVNLYKNHPAFAGLNGVDEPWYSRVVSVKAYYDQYKAVFPGKLNYLNLFPSYASQKPLTGSGSGAGNFYKNANRGWFRTYADYVFNTVQPDWISVDHYPVMGNTVSTNYLHDLEYVARKAKERGIPSNNFILTADHGSYSKLNALSDLRWQISCTMAYGYRSFVHYLYNTWDSGYEKLIDSSGNPTALYYAVQTANLETRAWEHVYMRYNWQGTATVGTHSQTTTVSVIPSETSNLFTNIQQKANINDGVMTAASVPSNQSALIGQFTDADGNHGFMVTNAERSKTADVTMTFAGAYDGLLVYIKGVPQFLGLNASKQAAVSLSAGEGAFVIPVKLR